MEGEATVTIATLLTDVGKVFTQSMTWVGSVAAKIVSAVSYTHLTLPTTSRV